MYARINRAINDNIYFISKQPTSNHEFLCYFQIAGVTNDYKIHIRCGDIHNQTCSCPDFTARGNICKHLYFTFLKLFKVPRVQLLKHKLDENEISNCNPHRYSAGDDDENDEDDKKSLDNCRMNTDCSICLDEIDNDNPEILCACCVCKNRFHKHCITSYHKFSVSNTCPLCRSNFK